jgi:hypothetical protein
LRFLLEFMQVREVGAEETIGADAVGGAFVEDD